MAKSTQAECWGIDFSRAGLAATQDSARALGVSVELVEADFFDVAALPKESFDVVYSGGFVEHFPDVQPLAQRLCELVRPGGVVVTTVPNLAGATAVRAQSTETATRAM